MSAEDEIREELRENFLPVILRKEYFNVIEKFQDHITAKCLKCPSAGQKGLIKGKTSSTGNFIRHYKVKVYSIIKTIYGLNMQFFKIISWFIQMISKII